MVMMVLNNAKIRTEAEWRGLLMQADSDLKVSSCLRTTFVIVVADRWEQLVKIHTEVERNFTAAVLEVRWVG